MAAAHQARASAALPDGAIRGPSEWPSAAYLWFLKAGLSRADIGRLGAYWSEALERVVLPVTAQANGAGEPVFWQARAVGADIPKYLAPDLDRSRVIPRWGSGPRVVLTEDILSAYKVGLDHEGWSMLGTKISDHVLGELMKAGKPVDVFLDNDLPPKHAVNRGQIAARKVIARLRAVGIPARNIVAPLDPKLMTRHQLKELLHVHPK